MPGPYNATKKRKLQRKAERRRTNRKGLPLVDERNSPSPSIINGLIGSPVRPSSSRFLTPPLRATSHPAPQVISPHRGQNDDLITYDNLAPQQPFIYDPGNGPRVRDTHAFMASKYFAQPPALDEPLCAEFAQEEVLQMLMTVLPEEAALILWYNKSRATSRICPACRRLYRLGDLLPEHISDEYPPYEKRPPVPQLRREQELSGLCSPLCFIVASFNYPSAIKSSWGRTENQIDDVTWEQLNLPPEKNAQSDVGASLGMLMRMTRLPDLGLAQLCLGLDDEAIQEEIYDDRSEVIN